MNKGKVFKWLLVAGGAYLAYDYVDYRRKNDYVISDYPRTFGATLYRILPTCQLSRMMGNVSEIEIPKEWRGSILGNFVKLVGCDMSEANPDDVEAYKSVSELFTRKLKDGTRPVEKSELVSPCDGKIICVGSVERDSDYLNKPVKGVKFKAHDFVGGYELSPTPSKGSVYYCVIYLSPGDCHRFMSPADWKISMRRYFPGPLMSVRPAIAHLLPALFCVNERVVYLGDWAHGRFLVGAVAATGVGNICIPFDVTLPSNASHQHSPVERQPGQVIPSPTRYRPEMWEEKFAKTIPLKPGEELGYFKLGSTLVLLFEANKGQQFHFNVNSGERVRIGQSMGHFAK